MSVYCVSIEPMYSQGVGNYLYLCATIEEAENFRDILRAWAINIFETEVETDDPLEEETGWEFFENVYTIEKKFVTKAKELEEIPAICILDEQYKNFWWLTIPKEPIVLDQKKSKRSKAILDQIPKMGHVLDNVQGIEDVPLEEFVKNMLGNVKEHDLTKFLKENADSSSLILPVVEKSEEEE
jgi:hypothetical protein